MPAFNLFCTNCQKRFIYASIKVEMLESSTLETHVCPYCQSIDLTEAPLETVQPVSVEAVYVHDLTTGNQEALNKLLAEGYVIVNRYAKQYHLEKPKAPKEQLAASQALSDLQEAEEA